jgi:hypothetical protein
MTAAEAMQAANALREAQHYLNSALDMLFLAETAAGESVESDQVEFLLKHSAARLKTLLIRAECAAYDQAPD